MSADLDTLSATISDLYQEVMNNKAAISNLAVAVKQRTNPTAAGESTGSVVPHLMDFDEINTISTGEYVKIVIQSVEKEWNRQITMEPGSTLVIESKDKPGIIRMMDSESPRLVMALSATLVLRNVRIIGTTGVLFEIDGERIGVGPSAVRFENVTFETNGTVLNVGVHGWCHLVVQDCNIEGPGKLYSREYKGETSDAKVNVFETKTFREPKQ